VSTDLTGLTIHEAHALLKSRQVSSVELTRAYLDRIRRVEPKVKAFVTVTDKLALEQAEAADRRIAAADILVDMAHIAGLVAGGAHPSPRSARPGLSTTRTRR
jgi:Asp-tRNA(Asn)/Glu-tRNA(Gln) amidotransferase A subunit family amidase